MRRPWGKQTLSWIQSDDQRALFGEILDECARSMGEPGRPRAGALLKLAAADAFLIGQEGLGACVRALADRLRHHGLRPDELAAFSSLLHSVSRKLRAGTDSAVEVETFRRLLAEPPQSPPQNAAPAPHYNAPIPAQPQPLPAPELYAPPMTPRPPAAPAPPRDIFGAQIFLETGEQLPVPSAPVTGHSPAPHSTSAAGMAILVDPGPVSRSMLARVMQKLGWQVEEHERAFTALEAWSRSQAGLFIADARRLRVAPRDLVEELQRRSGGRPVRLLLVADSPRPGDGVAGLESGVAGWIPRPVDETELRSLLESLFPFGGQA